MEVNFNYKNQYDSVKPLFLNWFVVSRREKGRNGWDSIYKGIVDSNNNIILPLEFLDIRLYDNILIADGTRTMIMDVNAQLLLEGTDDIKVELTDEYAILRQNERRYLLQSGFFYSKSCDFFKAERLNSQLTKLYGSDVYDGFPDSPDEFRIFNVMNHEILDSSFQVIDEINDVYFLGQELDSKQSGYDAVLERNGHILVSNEQSLSLRPTTDGFTLFKKDYKWGLFDPSFHIIISPKYDRLEFVEPGVLRDWDQLINYKEEPLVKSGKEYLVFPSRFKNVWKVTDNLFGAELAEDEGVDEEDVYNNNVGLIDRDLNTVLPFEYCNVNKFRWIGVGLYLMTERNMKVGISSLDGKKILLDNKYDHIDAVYHNGDKLYPFTTVWNQHGLERLYGIINENFVEVLPPVHQILRVPSEGYITFMVNNIWGIFHIDDKVSQLIYDCSYLGCFNEGLCRINKCGKIIIKEEYDDEYSYIEPYYNTYSIPQDGKWGFINTKGEVIIPIEYDSVRSFHEGLAPVCIGEKWGFINKDGISIVAPKYFAVTNFCNGMATCYLEHESWGNYEIIDVQGNILEKGYERPEWHSSSEPGDWSFADAELEDFRDNYDPN